MLGRGDRGRDGPAIFPRVVRRPSGVYLARPFRFLALVGRGSGSLLGWPLALGGFGGEARPAAAIVPSGRMPAERRCLLCRPETPGGCCFPGRSPSMGRFDGGHPWPPKAGKSTPPGVRLSGCSGKAALFGELRRPGCSPGYFPSWPPPLIRPETHRLLRSISVAILPILT